MTAHANARALGPPPGRATAQKGSPRRGARAQKKQQQSDHRTPSLTTKQRALDKLITGKFANCMVSFATDDHAAARKQWKAAAKLIAQRTPAHVRALERAKLGRACR